jgi:hypothetical protein
MARRNSGLFTIYDLFFGMALLAYAGGFAGSSAINLGR